MSEVPKKEIFSVIKRMENYPGFRKFAHVIQHGLERFIAKNLEVQSTEANDLSHIF